MTGFRDFILLVLALHLQVKIPWCCLANQERKLCSFGGGHDEEFIDCGPIVAPAATTRAIKSTRYQSLILDDDDSLIKFNYYMLDSIRVSRTDRMLDMITNQCPDHPYFRNVERTEKDEGKGFRGCGCGCSCSSSCNSSFGSKQTKALECGCGSSCGNTCGYGNDCGGGNACGHVSNCGCGSCGTKCGSDSGCGIGYGSTQEKKQSTHNITAGCGCGGGGCCGSNNISTLGCGYGSNLTSRSGHGCGSGCGVGCGSIKGNGCGCGSNNATFSNKSSTLGCAFGSNHTSGSGHGCSSSCGGGCGSIKDAESLGSGCGCGSNNATFSVGCGRCGSCGTKCGCGSACGSNNQGRMMGCGCGSSCGSNNQSIKSGSGSCGGGLCGTSSLFQSSQPTCPDSTDGLVDWMGKSCKATYSACGVSKACGASCSVYGNPSSCSTIPSSITSGCSSTTKSKLDMYTPTFHHGILSIPDPVAVALLPPLPLSRAVRYQGDDDEPIGIAVNGVLFSNHTMSKVFDDCMGHVCGNGCHHYHYHLIPICLLDSLGQNLTFVNRTYWKATEPIEMIRGWPSISNPSPVVGWAMDGFPIMGPYDDEGKLQVGVYKNQNSTLDECNGKFSKRTGKYAYYLTPNPPYNIGCFRGALGVGIYEDRAIYSNAICPTSGINSGTAKSQKEMASA
eukprot:CAMPEP_0194274214 /NCGR_PEP_ID=MMETSP0169-20130528/7345_1 /TAXON_ID=218684 /ORGANISM="Corethron pennatum, Strain L29A3" /LENGTH=673 /DNA_ID=CAMNT_0039017341 /DNA_START=94 /DNA_END=2116 /DNA_ORIENTATION=-